MQVILKKKFKKHTKFIPLITIHSCFAHKKQAILKIKNRHFLCALGRNGITSQKKEGDGATPLAQLSILCVFFHKSLKMRPRTTLPARQIKENDGWCDDPTNANYNRLIHFPFKASAEHLERLDKLYNIVLILDWNIKKRIKNRGSAIFMHIAQPNYSGTEGCIAINKRDMMVLLPFLNNKTKIKIYR